MSNKITETLMSNPDTLSLFTEEQKKNFISNTISSIVCDEDLTDMVNSSFSKYLYSNANYKIKTEFNYNIEIYKDLPAAYNEIMDDKGKYFYVQEKLYYNVRDFSANNTIAKSNIVKIGFLFDCASLDSSLRDRSDDYDFGDCIFRESLDMTTDDMNRLKEAIKDVQMFKKLFKLDLQIDSYKGNLEEVVVKDNGLICLFSIPENIKFGENSIRIIFHMPKLLGTLIEVAIVDPTKSPKISLSYPEDDMKVEMFPFINKGIETSVNQTHEYMNGIYDITIDDEWIYPISGIIFTVEKMEI